MVTISRTIKHYASKRNIFFNLTSLSSHNDICIIPKEGRFLFTLEKQFAHMSSLPEANGSTEKE